MADAGNGLHILALNSGSSSLKFGLYRVGSSATETLISGEAESIGDENAKFRAQDSRGNELLDETVSMPSQREAIARIGRLVTESHMPAPAAIGHRIVHGGPKLRQHCLIDDAVLRRLEAAAVFAPLHTPSALSVIRFAMEHFPGLPQAACFDTAFHAGLPDVARVLPIAKELQSEGVQRYGFHGLSCESILRQLADGPPDRVVIAHLGNGASVTAVKGGKSIDTSMGLTPTGGVIMGTRSGDLDPGVLVYLMREKKFDAAMLEDLVDHQSGLFGISGVDGDMRRLHEAASSNADARLAVEMFCYSARKQVAAMIAALDGVDLIVFTGGIGENDEEARAAICGGLSWIGVSLDETRNRSANNPISNSASRCPVLVLPSQEDEQIAHHTWTLMQKRLLPASQTGPASMSSRPRADQAGQDTARLFGLSAGLGRLGERFPFVNRLAGGAHYGIISAVAGIIAYVPTRALGLNEGFWSAITAIAVIQTEFRATQTTARNQFAGAAIGGLVALCLLLALGDDLMVYGLAVLLSMLACWGLNLGTASRLAGITATIILLVPHKGPPEQMLISRLSEVGWGVCVAVALVWLAARFPAKVFERLKRRNFVARRLLSR